MDRVKVVSETLKLIGKTMIILVLLMMVSKTYEKYVDPQLTMETSFSWLFIFTMSWFIGKVLQLPREKDVN